MGKLNWAVTGDSTSLSDLSLPPHRIPHQLLLAAVCLTWMKLLQSQISQTRVGVLALPFTLSAQPGCCTDDPGYGVKVCGACTQLAFDKLEKTPTLCIRKSFVSPECMPILAAILSARWWLSSWFLLVAEKPHPSRRAGGASVV